MESQMEIHPLTEDRWEDLEFLFSPRGACGGCWCMYWKLTGKEFEAGQGEPNRLAQNGYVRSGRIPGLIGYVNQVPAGWIALEPRETYPRLSRSRILAPLDDKKVWSVTCFFVASKFRNRGLTVDLLRGGIEFAKSRGAVALEGYPKDTGGEKAPPVFIYTGTRSAFEKAGFEEKGRRSEKRPIMRYEFE